MNLREILLRWSLGWVSQLDSEWQTIWIVDAHRGNRKRFVVRADAKLTAFLEFESAIHTRGVFFLTSWRRFLQTQRR
jgi:hypothetical protein